MAPWDRVEVSVPARWTWPEPRVPPTHAHIGIDPLGPRGTVGRPEAQFARRVATLRWNSPSAWSGTQPMRA